MFACISSTNDGSAWTSRRTHGKSINTTLSCWGIGYSAWVARGSCTVHINMSQTSGNVCFGIRNFKSGEIQSQLADIWGQFANLGIARTSYSTSRALKSGYVFRRWTSTINGDWNIPKWLFAIKMLKFRPVFFTWMRMNQSNVTF